MVHWGLLHQDHTRSALGHSLGVGSTRCTLILVEIAKCVEFCHMSSGWFDHTEPSLSGVQGANAAIECTRIILCTNQYQRNPS